MNEKLLVTYATVMGSTREIAECIGAELTALGHAVEVRPCQEVKDLAEYQAVVVGAPLYMFRLNKAAVRFLQRNQKQLVALPVAVFAGGPYGENVEKDTVEVQKNLTAELAKLPWLHPVDVLVVGGRIDPAHLRFPYSLIPVMRNGPAQDARNWDEIRAWARALPAILSLPV